MDLSKIDLTKLKKLRARHQVIYDGDYFIRKKETTLTQYTNVDDVTLKRASIHTLEGVANRLIKEAERKEQAEKRMQAPRFDRLYIERADYPITALYSDLKTEIEYGNMTWDDYRAERKKWKKCRHKFCLNMFSIDNSNLFGKKARRMDSRYCCDDCRELHRDSEKRFEKYGTYLPIKDVEGRLSESVDDMERKKSFAYEADELDKRAYHFEYDLNENPIEGVEEQLFARFNEKILEQTFGYPCKKSLICRDGQG